MKIFLLCSIIGMLAAGIYGTIDLTFDIKNGTLIRYDSDEPIQSSPQFAGSSKGMFKKTNLHLARSDKKISSTPTLLNSFADLSISDFSRGEPPMYFETMLLEKIGQPDSLKSTDVSAAITDTIDALAGKVKTDPVQTKTDERKFSLKLYSRSRPRPMVIEEVLAIEIDSTRSH